MPDLPLTPRVPPALEVRRLGRVHYGDGVALQEDLVRRRREGTVADQLLLLEHPHVITLGRRSNREHLIVDERERSARGIELFESGRGGDITYHGPGQLVGYPILDLKPDRKDLHRYLRDLEEVLIRTLRTYGVEGRRAPGFTGVWTDAGKVAAIGVRVSSGWITSHGFALNVSTDLDYFDTIVPCGLENRAVASLETLTGRTVPMGEVMDRAARHMGAIFGREVVDVAGDEEAAIKSPTKGEPIR